MSARMRANGNCSDASLERLLHSVLLNRVLSPSDVVDLTGATLFTSIWCHDRPLDLVIL